MFAKHRSPLGLGLCLISLFCAGNGCDMSVNPTNSLPLGADCTTDRQCGAGQICMFGTCHSECETSLDCAKTSRCVGADGGNVCLANPEMGCASTLDCQAPLVCGADGQCRNECNKAADCPNGQACAVQKVCAESNELTDDNSLANAGGATSAGGGGSGGAVESSGSFGLGAAANLGGSVEASNGGVGGNVELALGGAVIQAQGGVSNLAGAVGLGGVQTDGASGSSFATGGAVGTTAAGAAGAIGEGGAPAATGGAIGTTAAGAAGAIGEGGAPAATGGAVGTTAAGAAGAIGEGGAPAATGGAIGTTAAGAAGAIGEGGAPAATGGAAPLGTGGSPVDPTSCSTTDLIASASSTTAENWFGGDVTLSTDDPCGFQGAIFAYSDRGHDSVAGTADDTLRLPLIDELQTFRLSPCAGGKCCISGVTTLWPLDGSGEPDYTADVWGAGIGLTLSDPGNGATKRAYTGPARGLVITLAGELNGQSLRLSYTQSAADDSPPLKEVTALGTFTLPFTAVSCPAWSSTCVPAGTHPYDLQIQVVGGDVEAAFDLCVTSITPLL